MLADLDPAIEANQIPQSTIDLWHSDKSTGLRANGSARPHRRLTDDQVKKIQDLEDKGAQGPWKQRMARKLGVHWMTIHAAAIRKTYNPVKLPRGGDRRSAAFKAKERL